MQTFQGTSEEAGGANARTLQHPTGGKSGERRLQIDNVLATQPELGPSVPDGGYGWVVVAAAFYIKIVVPSLSIAYGIFLMFTTIETGVTDDGAFNLWSNKFVITPLVYMAMHTLSEPICQTIIKNSKWPRLVALCGTCLTCTSLLLLWLSFIGGYVPIALQTLSGIFAGFGSALILTQVNIIVVQYFRLKLIAVESLLRFAKVFGVITTCLLLGRHVNRIGVPHAIMWYQLMLLISGLLVLALRKPDYLKGLGENVSAYNAIRSRHHDLDVDDEEDIFSNTTELQSPHSSLPHDDGVATIAATSSTTATAPRSNWERFNDDDDEDENNELPTPRELFTDGQINNNVTYSFEAVDTLHNGGAPLSLASQHGDESLNIFVRPTPAKRTPTFLVQPTFYKTVLLHVSVQYACFIFYALYPSYLYYSVAVLHKESITRIVSVIFVGVLFAAVFVGWWRVPRANRAFPVALLLWFSAIGHFLISDWKTEVLIVIGGIMVTLSTLVLEYVAEPMVVFAARTRLEYTFLKSMVGFSFILFFLINPSYENCFRFVGLLQFSVGSIWFCNFVYKKISSVQS